ncbi:MAG TPA: hypothetical protein VMZ92_14625 [Planctomycetota bacterium]|nr:hypothetical protein [Planctomycetota bacterium]
MFDRPSVLPTLGVLLAISVLVLGGYGWWNLRNQSTVMGVGDEKASPNGAFIARASAMWRESSAQRADEEWYEFTIIRKSTGHTVATRRIDLPGNVPALPFDADRMIFWAPDSSEVTFTDGANPICTLPVPQRK